MDGSRLVQTERSDILIDACPSCRGVWLDRGELDKILDRERRVTAGVVDQDDDFFREMEGRRPRPEPRPRYDDEGQYGRRRRGSFLEDLFDFD